MLACDGVRLWSMCLVPGGVKMNGLRQAIQSLLLHACIQGSRWGQLANEGSMQAVRVSKIARACPSG